MPAYEWLALKGATNLLPAYVCVCKSTRTYKGLPAHTHTHALETPALSHATCICMPIWYLFSCIYVFCCCCCCLFAEIFQHYVFSHFRREFIQLFAPLTRQHCFHLDNASKYEIKTTYHLRMPCHISLCIQLLLFCRKK